MSNNISCSNLRNLGRLQVLFGTLSEWYMLSCLYATMSLAITVLAIFMDCSEHLHQYMMNCLQYSIHFCGFFIMVGLRLRPCESFTGPQHSYWIVPSIVMWWRRVYLHKHMLYTRRTLRSDVLSKIYCSLTSMSFPWQCMFKLLFLAKVQHFQTSF
jgi:hypothetical protein